MPLCGLGLNRKVTPMEYKDVMLRSRKMMIETGKRGYPAVVQVRIFGSVVVVVVVLIYNRADRVVLGRRYQFREGAHVHRRGRSGGQIHPLHLHQADSHDVWDALSGVQSVPDLWNAHG
jgi:hypothetical protein